ncbi:ATP-binding cassette domain-containing protein, partial [Bifidobacterium catulorum]
MTNATIANEPSAAASAAEHPAATIPALRLDRGSYSYTKGGKKVLDGRSHDFQPGMVHAITGPSGAGKTTLLSLLSGLAVPTEGRVLYHGNDLAKTDRY